jgi:hypothetical protein
MTDWEYSIKGRDEWENCLWPLNKDSPEETWEEHLAGSERRGLEHRRKSPRMEESS